MASKKKWKARARAQRRIADELFTQVGMLSGQLRQVDEILINAVLPGPTIDAWAQQVRDLLRSLVEERGIVSGGIYQHMVEKPSAPISAAPRRVPDQSPDGEYVFLTDKDLQPESAEIRALLEGRDAT